MNEKRQKKTQTHTHKGETKPKTTHLEASRRSAAVLLVVVVSAPASPSAPSAAAPPPSPPSPSSSSESSLSIGSNSSKVGSSFCCSGWVNRTYGGAGGALDIMKVHAHHSQTTVLGGDSLSCVRVVHNCCRCCCLNLSYRPLRPVFSASTTSRLPVL